MRNKNICKFNSSFTLDTLSVSCFVLETDLNIMKKNIKLNTHCMILVTQGNGGFKFDQTVIDFNTGDLFFCFEGENFSVEKASKLCEYMYIYFEGVRADELLRRFNINKDNRCFKGFDGLIPFWRESLSRACEQTIDLASESVLLYTFSRFSGSVEKGNDLINKISLISEEHFTDSSLSIAAVSEELGYNSKYLSHFFKEKMNMSYSEYLRNLRVKYAVNLFDYGIDSVKNVAFLSGFTDPLYFSTVFKQCVGVSPKEYMNRLSKKEQ